VRQGDLRANLIHVTRGIIQFAREGLPLVMVDWTCKAEPTSASAHSTEPPGVRGRRQVANSLKQEIE